MPELEDDFQLTDPERIAFYYGCVFGGLLVVAVSEEREKLRALMFEYFKGQRSMDDLRRAAQAVHAA